MAERRMFAKSVVLSDKFLGLSTGAQLLYFHYGMHADDDGLLDNAQSILRQLNCDRKAHTELLKKGYLLQLRTNLFAIVHWHVHNFLRKDRHVTTQYHTDFLRLKLNAQKCYYLNKNSTVTPSLPHNTKPPRSTAGRPVVNAGKDRKGKDRLDKERESCAPTPTQPPPPSPAEPTAKSGSAEAEKQAYGRYQNVFLTAEAYAALATLPNFRQHLANFSEKLHTRGYHYQDHAAALAAWIAEDQAKLPSAPTAPTPTGNTSFDSEEFFRLSLKNSYGYDPRDPTV